MFSSRDLRLQKDREHLSSPEVFCIRDVLRNWTLSMFRVKFAVDFIFRLSRVGGRPRSKTRRPWILEENAGRERPLARRKRMEKYIAMDREEIDAG